MGGTHPAHRPQTPTAPPHETHLPDTNYGDLRQNHATAAHLGTTRLMLHARSLSFQSIENGETLTVCADTDESWRIWLDKFEA